MKTLYTDASFDYKHTNATAEPFVRGKIAVHGEGISQVDKVAVGKVPDLQQYINVLELTAIARAVELAAEGELDEDKILSIYSDSQVAVAWAKVGMVKKKISTAAHENALEYLQKAERMLTAKGGMVFYYHVPRDNNPAGHLLAEELKREAPHTV